MCWRPGHGRMAVSKNNSQKMTLLQVFNRYLQSGGEEKSVNRIHQHVSQRHEVPRCFFDSAEWTAPGAPTRLGQAGRFFYHPAAARRFQQRLVETGAAAALFHNLYPVGSPALYRQALRQQVPVIQYLHNYRPFSVGASLYYDGQVQTAPLSGRYWGEVRAGAWQGSVVRSALCALMLKMLHRSGWLRSVKAWVAISQFMADKLVNAGAVKPEHMHVLRHSWDAMAEVPAETTDTAEYLFLGRLIPEKGLHMLVQAWHDLHQQLGARAPQLTLAGEGPLREWIQQEARVNPAIHFAGHLSGQAKHEALCRCRALVAPSTWWEPLGLMIYEAYDHAKPVLAARSGALTETVLPGVTGLLHEPGQAAALVGDVLILEAMSATERGEMGQRGRSWLLREAAVGPWQDQFDQILQAALR
jgi:glycosyltransferase involved in cell wall biosynthesis